MTSLKIIDPVESKDTDNEVCKGVSFNGQNPQLIELSIDSANLVPNTNNNGRSVSHLQLIEY